MIGFTGFTPNVGGFPRILGLHPASPPAFAVALEIPMILIWVCDPNHFLVAAQS